MKRLTTVFLLIVFVAMLSKTSTAGLTVINRGQIFIGGTSYNTSEYQNYLRFYLNARRQNPRIEYIFFGEQNFSVYQDHPVQPDGPYLFSVKMPYSPDGMVINGDLRQPVWYSDCFWDIQSDIVTPVGGENSPQFVNVQAPFMLLGRMTIYGAASVSTRVKGFGTADLKFEKIGDRYYLLEARYIFGKQTDKNSK